MSELDPKLWVDLIGTPFKLRARGPDFYDCFGLLLEIYRRQGIIILDSDYTQDPAEKEAQLLRRLTGWARCDVSPGAGLLFREKGIAGHVGVAIDQDRFVHASEALGQVSVGFLSRNWRFQLISAYKFTQD